LRIFWRTFYWGSYVYSFGVMPLAMKYEISGEFEDKERVRFAIYSVLKLYTFYAIAGGVFVLFLWMRGTFDGSKGEFTMKGFLIAMSSAVGLL